MSGKPTDGFNFGFADKFLAENFDSRFSISETATERMRSLPADDENGVARVLNIIAEVMQDTSGFVETAGNR